MSDGKRSDRRNGSETPRQTTPYQYEPFIVHSNVPGTSQRLVIIFEIALVIVCADEFAEAETGNRIGAIDPEAKILASK